MRCNLYAKQKTWDDRVVEDIITVWDRWEPACDCCGRLESSLKERLMACSYCRMTKYCSDKCQKYDWTDGSRHKERCHLFEVDKKLSDLYINSMHSPGPRLNDPAINLEEKVSLWTGLHDVNFGLIQCAVFGNRPHRENAPHLGIFLKLVGNGPEHDHRSFIIDKVALIPWAPREGGQNIMTGCCLLPGGKISPSTWKPDYHYRALDLPPGFDLHRFITHINRGITHFHGSFWPLARRLSSADFEAENAPEQWFKYMHIRPHGFEIKHLTYDTVVTEVFGVKKRDGTQVPLYDYTPVSRLYYDSRLQAMPKVDSTEFKKLLDDPSRRLCMVHRPDPEATELDKRKSNDDADDRKAKRRKVTHKSDPEDESDDSDATVKP